jgi:Flp pilus assembly protein TadG
MIRIRRAAAAVRRSERGASAVEFALILPVLILLLLGLLEYGRVYNVQISLSNAAREGARTMAIHNDAGQARTAARSAAPSVNPALSSANVTVSPTTCAAGQTVTVTVHYDVALMTGFFGTNLPLTATGVMLCGG